MRRTGRSGSFLTCLLINMLLNLDGTIPAWVLLALHYLFSWPVWLFWLALGLWLLYLILWMAIIGWASSCGRSTPSRVNKNPYSAKNTDLPNK